MQPSYQKCLLISCWEYGEVSSQRTVTEKNSGVFSEGLMTASCLECFCFRINLTGRH